MEIAERKYGLCPVFRTEGETYTRKITGIQRFELESLFGLQTCPKDTVILNHGMGFVSDTDQEGISVCVMNGNMLFCRAIRPLGDKLTHRLATAFGGNSGVGKNSDDLSADVALIKTQIHFHASFFM